MATLAIMLMACAAAQDSPTRGPDYDRIAASCRQYLETFSSKADVEAMTRRLDSRVEDRVASSRQSNDTAAREIMLDWAADNRKKLEKKDRKLMIQACFYFVTFHERGYLIPKYLREELTPETVNKLCDFLDSEVDAAR